MQEPTGPSKLRTRYVLHKYQLHINFLTTVPHRASVASHFTCDGGRAQLAVGSCKVFHVRPAAVTVNTSSLAWMHCCTLILLPGCQPWLPHVHSSRCATVDLDSAAPSAMPSRRFGHLGPMHSPPSRVETVPSLKPSRALWMAPGLCLTPWLPRGMPPRPCKLQVSRPPRGMLCFRRRPLCLKTTPLILLAGGSALLHAQLMSSSTVPSAASWMPQALPCWTRSQALTPRVSSPQNQSPLSCPLSSSPLYRVMLLRRLRLPLPLTSARCRCRQTA